MIARTLEPEIMDEPTRAKAYADADFSSVNQTFVEEMLSRFPQGAQGRILDLGCGPADIPLRLLTLAPRARISALDASPVMLELARKRLARTGAQSSVELILARVPDLPAGCAGFDGVVSNSLAHHLPDPSVLWSAVKKALKPGGFVYITDLIRSETEEKARETVETYSGQEHPLLKDDFYHSLLAAFTPEEVKAQLAEAGLESLDFSLISDRHWLVAGTL